MHVVVFGAGAVGSVLGGHLALRKHDVQLVCRDAHARAITDEGLHLRSATGDHVAHPRATTTLSASDLTEKTWLILAVKSQDTPRCTEEIAAVAGPSLRLLSFQNGVDNEAALAERFARVYGGVCRMTCSMIQPGHASFRRMGRLVVGKHPKGVDPAVKGLAVALGEAGFDVCVSRAIAVDKWLKLAANVQSAFHAVIDEHDHDANEFLELKAKILEETRHVFKVARIKAKSFDGRDPSIDEMIDELRRPRARRAAHRINVHNSLWQDLYLRRDTIENPGLHRPLIEAARAHGVPTPYNDVALALAEQCHRKGTGPNAIRLPAVLALIEERKRAA
ncbi:MAG: 2-dehydropantoate 2-reductase [Candidatus Krumholzibacteria bacterium]|nr:2-dehydropantoate 2-reductase [Candidatus Krumholzibacteria bacterium]